MSKIENTFLIRKDWLNRLFLLPKFNLGNLFMLQKQSLVRIFYYSGILLAFYGSLTPWFLAPIFKFYQIIACFPIVFAMLLGNSMNNSIFSRKDYVRPLAAFTFFFVVSALVDGRNLNGIINLLFTIIIFFSLFRLNVSELPRLGNLLAISLACILVVSIPFFLLFLVGFPLPHHSFYPPDLDYSFENYRFFLVDDRGAFMFIPRYTSVFLEPSHLAMACITLLFCQTGKWKRWYNLVLFFALFLTFSLAGYVFIVFMFFATSWMQGHSIVGKAMLLILLTSVVVVGSLFYNKGDNLVNQLIVQRLTLNEDGELEGDNRVSGIFDREYEQLTQSPQILVGKGSASMKEFGFGNAGYKVFIYSNGLIGLFLLMVFMLVLVTVPQNFRPKVVFLAVQALSFIPHAMPIKYYFFIPLFVLLYHYDSRKLT
ncbi:MAG: hypothetical protein Q4E32_00915 [Bacteroidales bacterium]|nr:hypothetical protein [Bacteroidales bacterium]